MPGRRRARVKRGPSRRGRRPQQNASEEVIYSEASSPEAPDEVTRLEDLRRMDIEDNKKDLSRDKKEEQEKAQKKGGHYMTKIPVDPIVKEAAAALEEQEAAQWVHSTPQDFEAVKADPQWVHMTPRDFEADERLLKQRVLKEMTERFERENS